MKQQCRELLDLTEQTRQAEDQNNYWNYHPFDSHKMINLKEGSPEEDSLEEEDSPEEEDFPEEGDTQVEEEYHQGDHQEAVGDHHHSPCHQPIKGN